MYKAVKMTRLLIDTTNKAKLMFINFVNYISATINSGE